MQRFSNTTGPCNPDDHYMLPPEARLVRAQLDRYIDSKLYWVLHAPRQSGKTTFLQSWMRSINAGGKAVACYVSVETCQGITDEEKAIPGLCSAIRSFARDLLGQQFMPPISTEPASMMLSDTLHQWSVLIAPKPLVVLFDEVDVLQDQAMISFLRQLRSGFSKRGVGVFPISVVLVGMRDLRDYLVRSKDGVALNPGSPFNIKEDSASLSSFTREDVQALMRQHTAESAQVFSDDAVALVYTLTRGQPWLVNAILQQCTMLADNQAGQAVTDTSIQQARINLVEKGIFLAERIYTRFSQFPQLRLIAIRTLFGFEPGSDDFVDTDLLTYLGITPGNDGVSILEIPLIADTLLLELTRGIRYAIPAPEFIWRKPDGSLDMEALLKEFQRFWRRHADLWEAKADYTEAFPHLLLMAFLQRVVNGGGRIEREYAAGRGRMDLAVLYGGSWSIIEIKLVHPGDGRPMTVDDGLRQVLRYRDTIDRQAAAWLVVFDRTPAGRAQSWDERLTWETRNTDNGSVTVVGA
jgi:hypothetical protein